MNAVFLNSQVFIMLESMQPPTQQSGQMVKIYNCSKFYSKIKRDRAFLRPFFNSSISRPIVESARKHMQIIEQLNLFIEFKWGTTNYKSE